MCPALRDGVDLVLLLAYLAHGGQESVRSRLQSAFPVRGANPKGIPMQLGSLRTAGPRPSLRYGTGCSGRPKSQGLSRPR